jgi:hypothetical protein
MTIAILLTALHDGSLAAGAAGLLYSSTVTVTAMAAIHARTPAHRREAREVLALLLRRSQ